MITLIDVLMRNKKAKISIFVLITILANLIFVFNFRVQTVVAATNLIKSGSFEDNIDNYWADWTDPASVRTHEMYRAYDAPIGSGSYSLAIDAHGAPDQAFSAILSSKTNTNAFQIDMTKNYYLVFYAKANQNLDIIAYLQRTDTYNQITNFHARSVGTTWQKYVINLSPTATTEAVLAFVHGDMPDGASLYLDGVQVIESDLQLLTKEIKTYNGDNNKFLKINNIGTFIENDIEIELPYYNNLTSEAATIRIHPKSMNATGVYFDPPLQTFGGIGRLYVQSAYIGDFDYNVQTKISNFHPVLVRINEDVVVSGSGFSPLNGSTFLKVDYIGNDNNKQKLWIAPDSVDSGLSQMSFKLPAGVVPGEMQVQTSFIGVDGTEKINKSNSLAYKLKPIVYATEWSMRGYEHVGDKLKIEGVGLGRSPIVNFYDNEGNKIDSIKAAVLNTGEVEIIEVATTKKMNDFSITVTAGGVESDSSASLSYTAKAKLDYIKSKNSRTIYSTNEKIQAAKVGEVITLGGLGFLSNTGNVTNVVFQGYGSRIAVPVPVENIDSAGKTLKVAVPSGAQNGYINVVVNGQDSNYRAIEIIPTIVSISPNPVVPGQDIQIAATGVSDNLYLAKVNFKLTNNEIVEVVPYAINVRLTDTIVYAKAPMAISSSYSSINLQYDRWIDTEKSVLNVRPHIISASINLDNKILSIKGYGFSINPKENIITYMYADEGHTVINPKIKMLGVYPTEEGQEIRVQILDDYYYGNVIVQVGGYTSNEMEFGPAKIHKIARRVEYVAANNAVMGVLYISGYNFGSGGGVQVGAHWAEVHYRTEFFIIAVIDQQYLYDNPVIVARD